MRGKKSRILFASLFDAVKDPLHTVQEAVKVRFGFWKVENIAPDTFNRINLVTMMKQSYIMQSKLSRNNGTVI